YPINKVMKAHYALMNIECDQNAVDELSENFRYNDAVIRNMVLKVDRPISESSPISKEKDGRMEGEAPHHDAGDKEKNDVLDMPRGKKESDDADGRTKAS